MNHPQNMTDDRPAGVRPALVPADPTVRRSLCFLALFHLFLWTLAPTLIHVSPSLDIVESFSWGIEWEAGYLKHPPLSPWIIAASTALFGRNLFAVFLLSPLAILAALFSLWVLSRQFFDERVSTVGLYLASAQFYFNLLTPEFNHNVMQIPLWAGALALHWIAVTRGRLRHYVGLGLVLGLCALAKYSALLLYATLLGVTLWRPELRSKVNWRYAGVCAAIGAAVAMPNLIWQIVHGFPSAAYAAERMGETLSVPARLARSVKFLLAQIAILLPVIAAVAWARRRARKEHGRLSSFALAAEVRPWLIFILLVPILLCTLLVIVGGNNVRTLWGMPMFTAAGIAAVVALGPQGVARLFSRRWCGAWILLQVLALFLYATMVRIGPLSSGKVSRAIYPGPAIAAAAEADWKKQTGKPLRYVVGEVWTAGNVAFFTKARPSVFIDGDPRMSPWIDPERLRRCGALLIWETDEAPAIPWMRNFPDAQPRVTRRFAVPGRKKPDVGIAWSIVPPQGGCGK